MSTGNESTIQDPAAAGTAEAVPQGKGKAVEERQVGGDSAMDEDDDDDSDDDEVDEVC